MSVTDFTLLIKQNNLGRLNINPIVRPLVVGHFSGITVSGDIGNITTINDGNIASMGIGKGAEFAKMCLNAGLPSIDILPVAVEASAGARLAYKSAFTVAAGNLLGVTPGTVVPVLSGTALDNYRVRIEILPIDASNTSQVVTVAETVYFRYSLDDGQTWLATAKANAQILYSANPSDSVNRISSGLTVTFGAGTYKVGDVFNYMTFPASPTAAAISTALFTKIGQAGKQYTHICFPCAPNGSTTTVDGTNLAAYAVDVGVINTGMNTLQSTYGIPAIGMMEVPTRLSAGTVTTSSAVDILNDELDVTFQSAVDTNTTVLNSKLAIGYARTQRQAFLQDAKLWRSIMWSAMERVISNNDLSKSIYTVAPLEIAVPNTNTLYTLDNLKGLLATGSTYDESKSTNTWGGTFGAITNRGFLAVYTSPYAQNVNSYTFLAGNTHTDSQNDFLEMVYVQQFNELQNVIQTELYKLRGTALQVKKDGTGYISEPQARDIEANVQQVIDTLLVSNGYIPSAPIGQKFIIITRNWNLVSTSQLKYEFRIWVESYTKTFSGVGYLSL